MLDPKKKKIYIIIICVNLIGIAAVFSIGWGGFSFSGSSSPLSPDEISSPIAVTDNNSSEKSMAKKEYTIPKVFPQSTSFDTSVFQSSTFTTLRSFKPFSLQPDELGREDPFKTY